MLATECSSLGSGTSTLIGSSQQSGAAAPRYERRRVSSFDDKPQTTDQRPETTTHHQRAPRRNKRQNWCIGRCAGSNSTRRSAGFQVARIRGSRALHSFAQDNPPSSRGALHYRGGARCVKEALRFIGLGSWTKRRRCKKSSPNRCFAAHAHDSAKR